MIRRGFTMLEVLITSVVMVLLVLAAYPTLNTATQRQEQVANMTILESCLIQGIATAKAPTSGNTVSVAVKFLSAPTIGCEVAEVDTTGGRTVTASFNIANPSQYTLQLTPLVTDNEYIISVRPPYHFIVPDPADWQIMNIGLRSVENPAALNSTVFNLITGTIQSRNI